MTQKVLTFGSDTKLRKQVFTAESFAHPAKMHLSLQMYLIEHYTKAGETILDPMGGIGTLLMATTIGRNVVIVELEQKFVDMAEANWQKIKRLGPMLGYTMGEAVILQGDARDLQVLADKVVFSPPYADTPVSLKDRQDKSAQWIRKGTGQTHIEYGANKGQIGNLPYGKIDTVISSPPFGEAHEKNIGGVADKNRADLKDYSYLKTGTKGQIGDMPYKADVICTSPPYEGSLETSTRNTKGGISARDPKLGQTGTYADLDPSVKRLREHGRTDDKAGGPYGRSLGHPYSGAVENIGNLKSDNYLTEMLKVYRQCHSVLKDKGLMCIVVKNFIRDKKIVRLDLDTIKLCETAGFALKERLARKLTQQSFWRRIALLKCDHRKSKGQCKLGLECPVELDDKTFEELFFSKNQNKAFEECKKIIETKCPKYINTSPEINFEDVLIFEKLEIVCK